jgi:hypothetical protein
MERKSRASVTRVVTLSGTLAAVNRELKALTLILPKPRARAKVTLVVSAARTKKTATMLVSDAGSIAEAKVSQTGPAVVARS